jgi:hypothetical protein
MTTTKLEQPIPVFNVNGTRNQAGSIIETVEVIVRYKSHKERVYLYVTDLGSTPLIFGISWLCAHNPLIDWKRETIEFSGCPSNCQKIGKLTEPTNDSSAENDHVCEEDEHDDEHDNGQDKHICWIEWKTKYKLDKKIVLDKKLNEIIPTHLHDYLHVFNDISATCFPISRPWDHEIHLKPGFTPKSNKLYCLSPKEELEMDKFLCENLGKGYIRPLSSPQTPPPTRKMADCALAKTTDI